MKRLLLISSLFFCSVAHADYVVVTPYISGADVTIAALNNNQNAIVNTLNGNVEGIINIKPGSINTQDLSQAVSPITRWAESFNNYTVEGMLPVTSADLSSDISAGISYVNGYRVQIPATNHTYTANKDTYVYVNQGSFYQYCEELNGSTSCASPPDDSLLLAKVVTSGIAITSVEDSRTLSIQITTTTTNFPIDYRNGAYVSRDTTTTVHVEPGSIAIGNTIYTRSSDTSSKNVLLGSNWIESGYSPGGPTNIFIYAYNDAGSTWDFKYSSSDPVYSDTTLGVNGVLRYLTTGGTTYRAIGWAYLSADVIQSYQFGNFKDTNTPNIVTRSTATDVSTSSATYVDIPSTEVNFYSTGNPVTFYVQAPWKMGSAAETASIGLFVDGTQMNKLNFGEDTAIAAGTPFAYSLTSIYSQGSHEMEMRWSTTGSTLTQPGSAGSPRVVTVREE